MKKNKAILQALLPGARIDRNTNKISVHTGTSNDVIKINVGGTLFETYRSTLRAIPTSHLSDEKFLARFYRADREEYFFDRDPAIFHCVLNYFRSGELHLPTSVCGLVIRSELEFWGIDDISIEECCWSRYANWTATLQALRRLEDNQNSLEKSWEYPYEESPSCFRKVKVTIWTFLSQPSSSKPAQVYAVISLLVIFISIFSFCASTVKSFRNITTTASQQNQSLVAPKTNEEFGVRSLSMSFIVNFIWAQLLLINCIGDRPQLLAAETVAHPIFIITDLGCLTFFVLELLTRTLVTPRTLRFLLLPMTIIEILAVLTDLADQVIMAFNAWSDVNMSLVSAVNFMKLLRVFRIFRLMRHIPGLWILFYTFKASIKDLLLLLLFVAVGMLIFSSLVFFAENTTQEKFSSIPKCFWWSVVTMTTVGYGDMVPETTPGYFIGAATGIFGVLIIGFTVPVLVNNFVLYYNYTRTLRRESAKEISEGSPKRIGDQRRSSSDFSVKADANVTLLSSYKSSDRNDNDNRFY